MGFALLVSLFCSIIKLMWMRTCGLTFSTWPWRSRSQEVVKKKIYRYFDQTLTVLYESWLLLIDIMYRLLVVLSCNIILISSYWRSRSLCVFWNHSRFSIKLYYYSNTISWISTKHGWMVKLYESLKIICSWVTLPEGQGHRVTYTIFKNSILGHYLGSMA
jgi:hypothetical protein